MLAGFTAFPVQCTNHFGYCSFVLFPVSQNFEGNVDSILQYRKCVHYIQLTNKIMLKQLVHHYRKTGKKAELTNINCINLFHSFSAPDCFTLKSGHSFELFLKSCSVKTVCPLRAQTISCDNKQKCAWTWIRLCPPWQWYTYLDSTWNTILES